MNPAIKTPLGQKLGLRLGMRVACLDCPEYYLDLAGIDDLLLNIEDIETASEFDFVHIFSRNARYLSDILPLIKSKISEDGMIWISFPKSSSSMKSDLSSDSVREIGKTNGLLSDKTCSVDEHWAGLKFVFKKTNGESRDLNKDH